MGKGIKSDVDGDRVRNEKLENPFDVVSETFNLCAFTLCVLGKTSVLLRSAERLDEQMLSRARAQKWRLQGHSALQS